MFGRKQPCPHCGNPVRQPRRPEDYLCHRCGEPGPWATPDQIHAWGARHAARDQYDQWLNRVAAGGELPDAHTLEATAAAAAFAPSELWDRHLATFHKAAELALEDDMLTPGRMTRCLLWQPAWASSGNGSWSTSTISSTGWRSQLSTTAIFQFYPRADSC